MSYDRFLAEFPLPADRDQPEYRLDTSPERPSRVWLVAILFCLSLFAIFASAQGAPHDPLDAVVLVKTDKGGGSGVVVSPDGHVLTVEHVIGNEKVKSVVYRGREFPAKNLFDPEKNGIDEACLVQFEPDGPIRHLPVAEQEPRKGEVVYAFGYPALSYYSAQVATVTEIKRNGDVRIDAWIIEGNSGGPLLNSRGEVIGVASTRDALPPQGSIPGSTWVGLPAIKRAMAGVREQGDDLRSFSTDGELLYFYTDWCGPCKRMKPIVDRLKRNGEPIRKVDADREKQLVRKYNVRSVPTFVWVVERREVERRTGTASEAQLKRMMTQRYRRSDATIGDLFSGPEEPDEPEGLEDNQRLEPLEDEEKDEGEIDWSLAKVVILRSNPDLSDQTAAAIAALQDRLGGPFRRRLQDVTEGKADVELIHEQVEPTRYRAMQQAIGREAGELLVVVLTRQQDLGLIKGIVARRVQSSLSGYIDGDVPVEVISERVHAADYQAVESALDTVEPDDDEDKPWWMAGLAGVVGLIAGYVAEFIRQRRKDKEG